MWNLISSSLKIVFMSVEYRCTVCAKCTIAPKLFWMHLMVLLGDESQVETRFSLFRDSANLDAR
jgi:hypothetical protein